MNFRKTEILEDGKRWVEVPFESLVKGDIFRLFESDGSRVPGGPWKVTSEVAVEVDHLGNWGVSADPLDLESLSILALD